MADVVFLHIGAMKSGTTFLQSLMTANKDALLAAGCLFPGESWLSQVRAAQDIVGAGKDTQRTAASAGAWEVLVREIVGHPGTAVVSMEFLSFAGSRRVGRLLAALDATQVQVVLTVRDATATIPAHWQDVVRNGSAVSWPAFRRAVVRSAGRHPAVGLFWRDDALRKFRQAQDIDRILRTWRRHLPADRLRVVTVPGPGTPPELLWERFAEAVGLDPRVCTKPPTQVNQSLGHASTELLRRVNENLGRLRPSEYDPTLKNYLAARVLSQPTWDDPPIRLDRTTYDFGLAWNQRTRHAIAAQRTTVIGDLADLPTTLARTHGRESSQDGRQGPVDPQDEAMLAAAAAASKALRGLVRRRARRLRDRTGAAPTSAVEPFPDVGPAAGGTALDPVDVAAREVARLARIAIDLQVRLRRDQRAPRWPDAAPQHQAEGSDAAP